MKIVAKTKAVLLANTAETMAEVIIAFVVLSLVMALFAQGLRYATSAEVYAKNKTVTTDDSLLKLQKTLAVGGEGAKNSDPTNRTLITDDSDFKDPSGDALKLTQYGVQNEGDSGWTYYWVFDAG